MNAVAVAVVGDVDAANAASCSRVPETVCVPDLPSLVRAAPRPTALVRGIREDKR